MAKFSLNIEREQGVGAGINFADPNSPYAKFYLSTGQVLVTALIAAVFVLLNSARLWHTDLWGHLRFGESLLDTRAVPRGIELCSFADPAIGPSSYAWASQVVFAVTARFGMWISGPEPLASLAAGADSLRFLLAVLVSLRLYLLFVAFRRASQSDLGAFFGIGLIVGVGWSLAVIRPQVIAELIFAAMLMHLSSPTISLRSVILLPTLVVIWANAHGSYPIALITLFLTLFAKLSSHLLGPPPRFFLASIDPDVRRLSAALGLSVVGIAVLTPDGIRTFAATVAMASQPNVRAMDEWQPLFSPVAGGARFVYGVCTALLIAAALASRGRARPLFWLGWLAFGLPPVLSQRAVVWFLMATPWLALPELTRAAREWKPQWRLGMPSLRKTLLAGLIISIAGMWSIPVQRLTRKTASDPALSLSDATPWREALAVADPDAGGDSPLARAIRSAFPGGRFTGTIYPGETLGDFFVWRLPSPTPVFMFSHVHLFTPDHWNLYTGIRDARPAALPELDRSRVNLVVVEAELKPRLCQYLRRHPGWTVVTDEAGLAAKRDPRSRLFVAVRKSPL